MLHPILQLRLTEQKKIMENNAGTEGEKIKEYNEKNQIKILQLSP